MNQFEKSALFTRASAILGVSCYAIAALLAACGGDSGGMGYMAPSAPMAAAPPPAASITISVTPTTVMVGQNATITWSSNSGTTCMASGAWSGSKSASGTATVTPTAAGTLNYMLSCSGGVYSASTTQTATLTVDAVTAFSQTNLVSNGTVTAATTDANLINPWGLALSPTGPMWVANNGTQTSTLYDGTGIKQSLVVAIPPPSAGPANPTGMVFNSSSDFAISKNGGASSPALFIFSGEGGAISGWSQSVDPLNAITAYDDGAGGAVYKGLAIANNGSGNFLYATDFHNNKVDVFDKSFAKVVTSGGFTDPTLPAGYAPFGIQAVTIGTTVSIIVTYAAAGFEETRQRQRRRAGSRRCLRHQRQIPAASRRHRWRAQFAVGRCACPGRLRNAREDVADRQFWRWGDQRLRSVDRHLHGQRQRQQRQAARQSGPVGHRVRQRRIQSARDHSVFRGGNFGGIRRLIWPNRSRGNCAGHGGAEGDTDQCGRNGQRNGALAATATDNVGVISVKFFAGTALVGTATKTPFTVQWDTTMVANGAYQLTAQAADAAGNTTTSAPVAVTVSNMAAAPAPPPPPPPPGY